MLKRPESHILPDAHPVVKTGRIGILLMNLGTPEATSYWPMRRYLKEFLSDRRVIEVNPVIWWFILNGIILTTRPKRSGHAYDQIWNRERNESPLMTITRAQAEQLGRTFEGRPEIVIDFCMRYGKPTPLDRLAALKEQGCDRVVLFPLYPQYSATTTATALDKCFDAFKQMRWQPAVRTVPPYFDKPAYIEALAASLEAHLQTLGWEPDVILTSFHGLPKDYLLRGDPYHCHCFKTARLLRERMGFAEDKLRVVFQSRFGKAEWLQPYAQEVVEGLPASGVKKLAMIMPGFSADCVETLEEVAIGLGETFREKGGTHFSAVPCLNDQDVSIAMLQELLKPETAGWT